MHPTIRLPVLPPENCSSSGGDWSRAKPSRRRTLLVFMRASCFPCCCMPSGRCSAPPHSPSSSARWSTWSWQRGCCTRRWRRTPPWSPPWGESCSPCHCQVFGSGHQEPDAQDDKEGVQVHRDPVKVINMAKGLQIIWFQGRKLWLQKVKDQNNLCGDSDILYNAHPCANPLPLWQLQAKVALENCHLSHFIDSWTVLPTLWPSSCGQPGEAGPTI